MLENSVEQFQTKRFRAPMIWGIRFRQAVEVWEGAFWLRLQSRCGGIGYGSCSDS